jgi:AAHS family 4-hydroxybenzoate transporter-like MFS transporter
MSQPRMEPAEPPGAGGEIAIPKNCADAAAPTLDLTRLIDSSGLGSLQIGVVALCACVVMLDGFDVQTITYVAPALTKALGIERSMLGPVFSAGLFGTTLGALAFGSLADRFGRKAMFVSCVALFAVCCLATAGVSSVQELVSLRFIAGLGLGGVTPIAIALSSEYCPGRSRETLVMLMYCGFSIGAAGGGFISAYLIPTFGWPSVFIVGGALPIAMLPVLAWFLPESIRYLVARGRRPDRVRQIVSRLHPALSIGPEARFSVGEENPEGFPVRNLFTDGRAAKTALLWLMFFSNLVALYFLINWFPTLMASAGLSLSQAVVASALIQVGSLVGTLALAGVVRRIGAFEMVAAGFLLGALSIALLALAEATPTLTMIGAFVAGFFVIGTQTAANAVSALLYPATIRSTGIGWALGIGRSGSILGPLIGGALLSLHWSSAALFLVASGPAAVAAASAFRISRLLRREHLRENHAV